ncbi:MAG: hypothetical protein ACRDGA_09595, partial [Bacteroidota bacterium]
LRQQLQREGEALRIIKGAEVDDDRRFDKRKGDSEEQDPQNAAGKIHDFTVGARLPAGGGS